MHPIFKHFQATTIFKAFLLNAIAVAIISTLSVETRHLLTNEKNTMYIFFNNLFVDKELSEIQKTGIVFSLTLVCALISYQLLYLLFGYGGGMVKTNKHIKYY